MKKNKMVFTAVLLLIALILIISIIFSNDEKSPVLNQHDNIVNLGNYITYMTNKNDIVTFENIFSGDEISNWKDVIEIKTDEDYFNNTYKKVFLGLKKDGGINLIIGDECNEINEVEEKKNIIDIEVIQNYIFLLNNKFKLKVEDVEKYLGNDYDKEKEEELNNIFKDKKICSIEKNSNNIITINNYGQIEAVNIKNNKKANYVFDKEKEEYIKCDSSYYESDKEKYTPVEGIVKIKSDMMGEIAVDEENKIKVFGLYDLKDKIKNWENIKDIDYSYIESESEKIIYAIGIKNDGTIVSSYEEQNSEEIAENIKNEIEASLGYIEKNWSGIEKIYTCGINVVGVKDNGEVKVKKLTENYIDDNPENYEMLKNLKIN